MTGVQTCALPILDSGNLNYCDQCVLSKDNCSECGVMTYNLLDSLKLLMIWKQKNN